MPRPQQEPIQQFERSMRCPECGCAVSRANAEDRSDPLCAMFVEVRLRSFADIPAEHMARLPESVLALTDYDAHRRGECVRCWVKKQGGEIRPLESPPDSAATVQTA